MLWFRLRSLYHDIRHVMHIDSLPAPSTLAPGIAPVFFPITNENRNDRMSVEAALSAIPFTVHTSVALQRQMIGNGDSCSNLRITKVEYFQRNVAPQHEFLCFSYEDVATPGVSNFMVIERWGTDFQPPDNSKEKVKQHTVTLSSDNAVQSPPRHSPSRPCSCLRRRPASRWNYRENGRHPSPTTASSYRAAESITISRKSSQASGRCWRR
ncbi:hypothetical protein B0H10DRAFT_472410 [Mycena sp. CBHHK59/15]|nr:hypothetical protein B0H10DRAFT_472410 [Mycena sp. CBHHK59/15]